MGLGLSFTSGEGPRFAHPLRDEAAVAALQVPDMNKLRYVFDAVSSIGKALQGRVPLIGFSGSPWTLACYMVEGAGSNDYRLVKSMLYGRPDLMHRILAINAQAVSAYLNAQIDAGAQAVMVFDSWGGVLADGAFQRFSLDYTRQVVQGLQRERAGRRVPCIVFTKGGGPWLDEIAALGADVVGLDWTVNLGQARKVLATRWHCKATLIRTCCLHHLKLSKMRLSRCWTASAGRKEPIALGTGISSTSAMASASSRRLKT